MSRKQPPPPPGSERREHHRFDLVAQIELSKDNEVRLLQIGDISAGGLFVELGAGEDAQVLAGDRLHIVLDLGDDSLRLEAEAEVVRLVEADGDQSGGFAVMWTSSDPATLTTLARILAKANDHRSK